MDVKAWRRDPEAIHALLKDTPEGQLIARKPLRIYLPRRFEGTRLGTIAKDIRVLAVFMIASVEEKVYSVCKACSIMVLTPTSSTIVDMPDGEYYEFSFDAGQIICPNIDLVKDDTLPYAIFDEIMAKGHIPWYFTGVDLSTLLESADYHAGLTFGPTNVPIELIASSMMRNPDDLRLYYRFMMEQSKMLNDQPVPPGFIALNNIIYGTTDTVSKIVGSYFDDSVTSALVNVSEKKGGVETLLRK